MAAHPPTAVRPPGGKGKGAGKGAGKAARRPDGRRHGPAHGSAHGPKPERRRSNNRGRRLTVLRQPVLVLNRSMQPIQVTCVADAIRLMTSGRGEGINHTDGGDWRRYSWAEWEEFDPDQFPGPAVHTPTRAYLAPEIVVLTEYDDMRAWKLTCTRANVIKRDKHRCQYCRKQFSPSQLTLDHVLPRSRGGKTQWDNVVASCAVCNQLKENRTPAEAGMPLLKTPERPDWRPFAGRPRPSWVRFLPPDLRLEEAAVDA